ncbi:hypothetical protein F5J12DRAFT_785990 [Pisolithus orientalis]|uniref:uncharacterized protein n=1 Tax=Pisolithus orientalis TaxID=936130 RepID=UPI002224AA68|nr:uncharacterized protein F5J12DRAFT_785990 [Pisolithus orientalis]KAI5993747.1 hypothetical protein F5J12DRAFT_785990 [Pisolithus orientalis]
MVLVPVHTYTVDLLLGGQAGQAWYGIISGQAFMALALGWCSWHWCWDSLTDGLVASGMCQNSLQWCWDGFPGIGVVLEHITMVLGWLPWHWCCARTQWCWNGLHDGLMALGMCWHSLQRDMLEYMELVLGWPPWHWSGAGTHYNGARMACTIGLMVLEMCQNTWHRFQDGFHGIGVVLEHIPMVLGWPA